jgi:hypothetical protein
VALIRQIWEGPKATKEEKKETLQFTIDFCKNHPDGRLKKDPTWWDNNVFVIRPKQEPTTFTSAFFGWDTKLWKPAATNDLKLAKDCLLEYKYLVCLYIIDLRSRTYTLEELLQRPDTVDPSRLEAYLSDADFVKLFGCHPKEFDKLPLWKKEEQKKMLGLF